MKNDNIHTNSKAQIIIFNPLSAKKSLSPT